MRTGFWVICFLIVFAVANLTNAQELLSEDAFTEKAMNEFRSKAPDYKIRKAGYLHLHVEVPSGEEMNVYLDNAYKSYRAYPNTEDDILATYIAGWMDRANSSEHVLDPSRIVPVIKDKNYIPEIRQSILNQGASLDDWDDPAHEPLNSELMIVYAEDSETRMRFVSDEELDELGLRAAERRALAVGNLKALLPPLEAHGGDGIYLLSVGGDYETSLLLFDSFWESGQLEVKGEIVTAVPARGLLVVTGSQDPEGLQSMKEIVAEASQVEAYPLTDRLFVYRNGRFEIFE